MSDYLQKRMQHILADRPLPEPKKYTIKNKSDKRAAKEAEQKELRGNGETEKEKWFQARRKQLTGICQCGCARKSSKNDEMFRSSCCHIFPQRLFPSIQLHPLNCVERNFWDGCHTNMDNRSMDLWPNMADWNDIKERFYVLAPLLTDQERTKKFYRKLESMVYSH